MEQIEYLSIAPIESAAFQLVSYFWTRVNQQTQQAFQLVLQVALDKNKAGTEAVDFPVYVPATGNYKSEEHHRMFQKFSGGDPFVAVRLQNFKVYHQIIDNENVYWGVADSFEIVEDPASLLDKEILL